MKFYNPIIKKTLQTIYSMRHFESEGNAIGMDDESLANKANHRFSITKRGYMEQSLSSEYIWENNLINSGTGLYTTEFLRAQESMEGIINANKNRKFKVIIDPRLDEWWKGIFYSIPKEILSKKYSDEIKIKKREGWHHYRPPQGQSGKDVEINLLSFLQDVEQREIFIVGHGRSLGFLLRILTNKPVNLNCKYPIPKNGEIWKFSRNGDYFNFKSLFVPQIN